MNTTVSRRRFLQGVALCAGAIGAPTVIASSAFGKGPSGAPSNKTTIGCIGVGGMGTGNMRVFLGLEGCRVVAVCDTYEGRRRQAKQRVDDRYGDKGCATYADYRELLARKDIDAVMIAPQDHWHALVATAAVKAGKDMYCEKPLGVSFEEGRCMRDAVRGAKRVFQTGTWQRSQGKFQHACRLVRNGYVGKIHTVEVAAPGPNTVPSTRARWTRSRSRPASTGRCGAGPLRRSPTTRAASPGPTGT